MILGKIFGKITTTSFKFHLEAAANKFDYVQILHKDCGYVLCQIIELTTEKSETVAKCHIIGYKDKEGKIKQIRTPFASDAEVLLAQEALIKEVIKIDSKTGTANIGFMDGKKIKVNLDLRKLLTKHVAILAKTGSGKSYISGVLIEEIMEKKIPLLIFDPHGEYASLKFPNDNKDDREQMSKFGVKPKSFINSVQEYSLIDVNPNCKQLVLDEYLKGEEIIDMLPAKMSAAQKTILFSVLKDMDVVTFDTLIDELERVDNNGKWAVISTLDYVRKLRLFGAKPTAFNELIQPGKCTIINLKGVPEEASEIICYKLLKDLFGARKKEEIPPFFCVLEEAHNFIPERSFGEKKCSSVIRTLAAEGRKFGLGLCIISQRPARIDKNVLSQCNTQIILKVTNPGDLKAIGSSVEGITNESEGEIKNLPIGTALVTGVVDAPLLVNIRPRKTKHGGDAVDILDFEKKDMVKELKEFEKKEILPVIDSKFTKKDMKLMQSKGTKIQTYLIPSALYTCGEEKEFFILLDLVSGNIIADTARSKIIPFQEDVNLTDYQTYEKVKFKQITYDKQLEKKYSPVRLRQKIQKQVTVKGVQECFLVHHFVDE